MTKDDIYRKVEEMIEDYQAKYLNYSNKEIVEIVRKDLKLTDFGDRVSLSLTPREFIKIKVD